ncbi:MAG TPA: ribosome recycling factor [Candidatus Paceibacterota bacterium]|nr:ribosome recycling factor [Candidatus Paceibacterota bacterium]
MTYSFNDLRTKLTDVSDWLGKELSAVHTGRASIGLLDGVRVDTYGSPMPLQQLANMTVEDARTIRIAPWDAGSVQAIEKALRDANLGVSVVNDGKGIRAVFPELTGETREKYAKAVGKKLEEARISTRTLREEVWSDIQKQEKEGKMSEDDKFRSKETMETLIKEANERLEAVAKRKEEEILGK